MAKSKEQRPEPDVEAETHGARSRAGKHRGDGTYVGATGPDDAFDVGETGAEARSNRG
jgi:hypothetical protein